jgi:hypothetical protein
MKVRPSYAKYERRRLGNPGTQWEGIAYSVRRSFGASSFGGFWRYWNPLFSYFLYYLCYKPLSHYLPRSLAVLLTFLVSGAIHDLVASLVTLKPFILFTPVFLVFGLLVCGEEQLGWSFKGMPFWLRASIHSIVIVGTMIGGVVIRGIVL